LQNPLRNENLFLFFGTSDPMDFKFWQYNAGIEPMQGNMPIRLCATPAIAPILAHLSECLLYPLSPSWHKAYTEPFSEASQSSKEAAPCSRFQ